jgi:AraC-like DNA-binding protein
MPTTSRPLEAQFDETGLCLLESRHSDDFRMTWSRAPFWKVLLATRGGGTLNLRQRSWPLHQRVLAVVPAGLEHRLADQAGTPLSLFILCIADRAMIENLTTLPRDRPSFIADPAGLRRALELLRRLLVETSRSGPAAGLRRRGISHLLLAELLENAPETAPGADPGSAAARVRSYLADLQNTFYRNESLDEVAARLGLSRRALTQQVREQTGASLLDHRNALRVSHARRLLRETARSLAAIAFECGFEDLSNFYRVFRAATGQSPGAWRKALALPPGEA